MLFFRCSIPSDKTEIKIDTLSYGGGGVKLYFHATIVFAKHFISKRRTIKKQKWVFYTLPYPISHATVLTLCGTMGWLICILSSRKGGKKNSFEFEEEREEREGGPLPINQSCRYRRRREGGAARAALQNRTEEELLICKSRKISIPPPLPLPQTCVLT